jgi:hypothetical protein
VGRSRSLTLKLKVDEVAKRHVCQHNEKHVLHRGDRRLKVTVGRTDEHYCVSCARRFIKESIARLEAIDRDLQVAEAGDTASTTGPGEASA